MIDNDTLFALALALSKKGGGGGSSIIDDTTTASDKTWSSNKISSEFNNLPQPMVFKGTLGTGGTISTLPTASSENEGYVYIVITDGTYAGQSAKAGDTFVSDGSEWVLIPSADDSGSLVISQTLTAGQTSITFTNAAILATSFISVASEAWYESVSQSAGSVTITFPEQSTDMLVQIMVAS